VKDEVEGSGWIAVVEFEEVGQRLSLFEGDDGEQSIACEGQIQGGFGPSVPVAIFLPGGGVALVVVAVFDAPVPPDSP